MKNKNFFIDEYDPQNEVYMGPNIKPVPRGDKLPDTFKGKVCLKVGDNISTDTLCHLILNYSHIEVMCHILLNSLSVK